ncbi:MAG TPA: efflux transporter outer membrane subunit [Sphingomonas sp.]|uniref:efflux transporter outer membrane subunit n=1 Tax=Sphingomonas sp. TaxID=28214 RepID=UPI002C7B0ED8|nr:efflux transporter outer membrane subunit [Sphingomonas sp.]HMI20147.1 efflux transporter outer membrane subunit [Sphingomonas sp.]
MKRLLPLTALLLAGCDLAPHYNRAGLPAPASLPSGGIYPVAATPATQAPDLAWQDFFVDPALRQVIATGLANNRDLRVALANVEQARAQYRVQRADLLPTIGANAGATYARGSSAQTVPGVGRTSHIYSVDAGFSAFEIDLFGRVRNLTKAALDQYLATEEGARATRITLISEIASAYLTMAADQDQLRISQSTLESFRQTVDLTTAQFDHGVISELEVRQAQTNYEQARYDIAALQTQIARDQNALNLLVGTTVAADLLPTALDDHGFTLADLPAGLSSDVLLRRPDVLQAEDQLKAQYANIGAGRAAFFPQISLTALAGTLSSGLSGLFDHGNYTYQVAPAASQTIFDFGRNAANLRYAKASRDAALATYEKAIQTAFREVADALAERGTIDEQLTARANRVEAAGTAYKLSDARYRSGVDPFLTTLDSQRTFYAAQQNLVQTRLDAASNLVELYRALGGGLRSH